MLGLNVAYLEVNFLKARLHGKNCLIRHSHIRLSLIRVKSYKSVYVYTVISIIYDLLNFPIYLEIISTWRKTMSLFPFV